MYRDDGQVAFKNKLGLEWERKVTSNYISEDLKVTIQCNLKIVDYLDVTFNLTDFSIRPFNKTSNEIISSIANRTTLIPSSSSYIYLSKDVIFKSEILQWLYPQITGSTDKSKLQPQGKIPEIGPEKTTHNSTLTNLMV